MLNPYARDMPTRRRHGTQTVVRFFPSYPPRSGLATRNDMVVQGRMTYEESPSESGLRRPWLRDGVVYLPDVGRGKGGIEDLNVVDGPAEGLACSGIVGGADAKVLRGDAGDLLFI